MRSSLPTRNRIPIAALTTGIFALVSEPLLALDLYVGAVPQAQTNTCQSYASVLALAAQKDPAFSVESFAELRQLEANFRAILDNLDSGTPYTHTNWPKAMEQLTGGAYTFKSAYVTDIVKWMSDVRDRTTMSDDVDAVVATLTGSGFDTVLTSVNNMNGSSYSTGHIVTVLGIAGSGISSDTQLIAFNSAIKGQGGSINKCSPGDQPGDMRYQAGVVETDNFSLREFGGLGYLMMWLHKN